MGSAVSAIFAPPPTDPIKDDDASIVSALTGPPELFSFGGSSDDESGNDEQNDFVDFTVGNSLAEASAGTNKRMLRVVAMGQDEKDAELLGACTTGDTYEVELLLRCGARVRRTDWGVATTPFQLAREGKDRWTALHVAARNG